MKSSAALHYPVEHAPEPGTSIEVAPGVRWLRMPLPFKLDHINLWLLRDGDGWTLVDAGIALDAVRGHWEQILHQDLGGAPLKRIVVTHFHPDHLGLAEWLAQRFEVPVIMTQGEYLMAWSVAEQVGACGVAAMIDFFRRHGLSAERIDALERRGNAYRRGVPSLPASYQRIIGGNTLSIDGRAWRVIVGYGHSPEHASLHCEELGVLISGDMLLPRISTNVSVPPTSPDGDPLALYLDSIRRCTALPGDTLVLPSHGRPFRGLVARVAQLEQHHRDRCDELLAACSEPCSAWELTPVLFPRELDTHQTMFAMGEAIAHLNYLEQARALKRADENGVIRYAKLH
jgi:glyoxylase-like metal-dependent hydrolase (beta-lactamase superfamily II)